MNTSTVPRNSCSRKRNAISAAIRAFEPIGGGSPSRRQIEATMERAGWIAGRDRFRRGVTLAVALDEQRARMERLELPEVERQEWLCGFHHGYIDARGT